MACMYAACCMARWFACAWACACAAAGAGVGACGRNELASAAAAAFDSGAVRAAAAAAAAALAVSACSSVLRSNHLAMALEAFFTSTSSSASCGGLSFICTGACRPARGAAAAAGAGAPGGDVAVTGGDGDPSPSRLFHLVLPSSALSPSRDRAGRSVRLSATRLLGRSGKVAPSPSPSSSSPSSSPAGWPGASRRSWESLFSLSMSGLRPGGFRFEVTSLSMESSCAFVYLVTFGGLAFRMLSKEVPLISSVPSSGLESSPFSSVGAS
mmetsp:Transcript_46968/g.102166  ORF Transcript_46968/g.102166 Transcript_46968/m.102166 type:complete len:269 (+) Transcript_46968:642-1448(+)